MLHHNNKKKRLEGIFVKSTNKKKGGLHFFLHEKTQNLHGVCTKFGDICYNRLELLRNIFVTRWKCLQQTVSIRIFYVFCKNYQNEKSKIIQDRR